VIDGVLSGDRPPRDIVADAISMRAEMAAHKPPAGPLDAKLSPGGLVDLEFAVHVVQLTRHAGLVPHLGAAIGELVAQRLASPTIAAAHDFLTRLLVTLRLVAPDAQPPALATRNLIARALDVADWEAVVASFAATRQEVSDFWAAVAGQAGQILGKQDDGGSD
jgi:glutamate-ammonia-ligase adenylyltransferase